VETGALEALDERGGIGDAEFDFDFEHRNSVQGAGCTERESLEFGDQESGAEWRR
jgi:hypothetical protein